MSCLLVALLAGSKAHADDPPLLEAGTPVRGELGPGDATFESGEYVDRFRMRVHAGQTLVLLLRSIEFDAWVQIVRSEAQGGTLFNDDHQDGMTDARLVHVFKEGGVYVIEVTSSSPGESGSYLLTSSLSGPAGGLPVEPPSPESPDAAEHPLLRPGAITRGRLAEGDEQFEAGEYVDRYRLRAEAGESFTITVRSTQVDSWVQLELPESRGGTIANDDFEDDSVDARIVHTFAAAGTYVVEVTSSSPGESGAYTLTVEQGELDAPTANAGDPGNRRTLRGYLGEGDRTLAETGEFYDHYLFRVQAGDQLEIYTGAQVNAYLIVEADGIEGSLEDDDGGSGHNARVSFTAPQTGDLEVTVTTSRPGQVGTYSLVVEGLSPVQGLDVYEGRLEANDAKLTGGEYLDEYSFHADAGETLVLTAQSVDFDAYLLVVPPEGEQIENDDADGKSTWWHARIVYTCRTSGQHTVSVTSNKVGEVGAYQLWVRRVNSQSVQLVDSQDVQGVLAAQDVKLPTGEFMDRYRFSGVEGQEVVIDMDSSDFDAYLGLIPPEGEAIENDDRGPEQLGARLELRLPRTGVYRIVATSATPGETGKYRITVRGRTGRIEGDASQAVAAGRKYWAILVGITDYEGEEDDLENCREDAEKLGAGLTIDGVINTTNLQLLLDEGATVDAIRQAFHAIKDKVGPRDVFLFFFSGHGERGEHNENATDEADRRDEYLVARGGSMIDDELNQLFGLIKCKTKILCLDCCYAGGFSRDVISEPGRMGIFSSEEDVQSLVAGQFNAGGYLSYFFRRALRGDADTDPTDGTVTVGELTEFLRREWRNLELRAPTDDGALGHQHLVVDRGGVQIGEELVRIVK